MICPNAVVFISRIRNSTYMTVPWIWAPESLAGSNGMDLLTSLNTRYNWTLEFIDFMRQSRQFGQHLYHCLVDGEDAEYGNVRYPQLEQEYQPINPCAIFWYYPKIPLVSCGSIYPFESALAEYGVTNYTLIRNSTYMTVPWIWAPESLAGSNGMDLLTSLNTRYNWTLEFIDFMRQSRQFGQHLYHCLVDGEDAEYGNVRYPQLEQEYQPINPCV
ncbi:hypothetical protein Fcan01_26198 [Folsomia candida]|uniref:Uncharacterized protein n=1 Tax=Folsomia candida TaxID=158441 RepID=A0A226D0Q4_FOLCA|nr:hypothetical protein Fcan01_26198 [Folsomia candida]